MRKLLPLALISLLACTPSRPGGPSPLPERFDRPDEAAEYYALKRGITPGMDVNARYAAARSRIAAMPQYSTADDRVVSSDRSGGRAAIDAATRTVAAWTQLGPGNIGGRTRTLVFDPRNANVLYAGGTSGGIWKTTDAGARWTAVGDAMTNLAVNALAIDETTPDVLYAGTGEGYYREEIRGTALPLRGDGIFVTRDAGATWEQLPATANNDDFRWVNDLAISRIDPHRIYAATRTGVWRTADRGISWMKVLPTTVKGGCLDLALRPSTGGDYLFASCGVFEQATVYRNEQAEGDGAWTPVLSEPGMSRTSLAIAPSRPSTVYALAASNLPGPGGASQHLHAVYRSDSNGDAGSWNVVTSMSSSDRLSTVLLSNPIAALYTQCNHSQSSGDWVPMGWHCNVIAVDPTNAERVWAGGVDLFRSDDGGRTWAIASYWHADDQSRGFVHADQHVIAFHPGYDAVSNRTMFVTNDGGVFRTNNATGVLATGVTPLCNQQNALGWTSLDHNYGATQFYHGAVFPDGSRFIGGAQDNGTILGDLSSGSDAWQNVWGGDGGYVAVDPVTPNVVYAESQNGALVKSIDGARTFSPLSLPQSGSDYFLFITPFALDPNQHTRLWVAGDNVWRSDTGGTVFVAVSAPLGSKGSAIAVAPGMSDRVLVGSTSGAIYRTGSATSATMSTSWSSSTPRPGFVSSLAFDPLDANTVYATYAGFGGGAHVWQSVDGGVTWRALDGEGADAIPDLPVHSLVVDTTRRGRIYLGTDLGVFVSLDGGAHWMAESSGLPDAVTELVTIAPGPRGPSLYAFTHGRGVWRADLIFGGVRRRSVR